MSNKRSRPKKRTQSPIGTWAALALAATAGYYAGSASARTKAISLQPLLKTEKTISGQTIAYPQNAPAQITAAVVTLAPGAQTGWHTHPVPLFGYVLEGEIRVDYGNNTIRTYRAGDALIEAIDQPHDGHNRGSVPAKILSVFIGARGVRDTQPAKRPRHHPTP